MRRKGASPTAQVCGRRGGSKRLRKLSTSFFNSFLCFIVFLRVGVFFIPYDCLPLSARTVAKNLLTAVGNIVFFLLLRPLLLSPSCCLLVFETKEKEKKEKKIKSQTKEDEEDESKDDGDGEEADSVRGTWCDAVACGGKSREEDRDGRGDKEEVFNGLRRRGKRKEREDGGQSFRPSEERSSLQGSLLPCAHGPWDLLLLQEASREAGERFLLPFPSPLHSSSLISTSNFDQTSFWSLFMISTQTDGGEKKRRRVSERRTSEDHSCWWITTER